jgi:hypothetical protein
MEISSLLNTILSKITYNLFEGLLEKASKPLSKANLLIEFMPVLGFPIKMTKFRSMIWTDFPCHFILKFRNIL